MNRFYFISIVVILPFISCQKYGNTNIPKYLVDRVDNAVSKQDNHRIVDIKESNEKAPSFTATGIDGIPFTLSQQAGKVVILNFWYTSCGPCIGEIPHFVNMQKELGKDKVEFVGVAPSTDNLTQIKEIAKERNINYRIIQDDGNIVKTYYPPSWPSTYIIGKDGKMKHYIIGSTNKQLLKPVLEKLLRQQI